MDRRTFLKTAGAVTAGGLATPAISQRAAARTLRFVPQADLANFDPIWNSAYVVRNASAAHSSVTTKVCGNPCPASSRRARRSTTMRAAKVSKVRGTWTLPSGCWGKAAMRVSRSDAWRLRARLNNDPGVA
jgi:TAT (twin-arginine translocation) pathway signal sequence